MEELQSESSLVDWMMKRSWTKIVASYLLIIVEDIYYAERRMGIIFLKSAVAKCPVDSIFLEGKNRRQNANFKTLSNENSSLIFLKNL